MTYRPYELSVEEILFSLPHPPPSETDEEDGATVIGQARALSALSLGLGIRAKGYNVFIMGAPGTGRRTALLKALSEYTVSPVQLQDKAYVTNFSNPLEPRALSFTAGRAVEFKKDLHDLVEGIKSLTAIHAESDAFKSRKSELVSALERQENKSLSEFESEVAVAGFQIVQISAGEENTTDIVPLRDGKPSSFDELQALVATGSLSTDEWNALRESYYGFMDRMKNLFDGLKRSRAGMDARINELRREMLRPLIEKDIASVRGKFQDDKVGTWLGELLDDIIDHLYFFQKDRIERESASRRRRIPSLSRYGVNVVVDRSGIVKPPVVFENRPTLANLVGIIDQTAEPGEEYRAGYLRIRAGTILKASGGVLVLKAEDILEEEDSWQYLKRVLQTGKLEIQPTPSPFAPAAAIKPEAVDVSLKVVIIGGEMSYDLLYQTDPDFQKLFKVCAEFDSSMSRTQASERSFAAFFRRIVKEEGLRPLSPDGVAAALERSVRDAENRTLLSTRFSLIADLLREADWWASVDGKTTLDAAAIRKAMEMRQRMHKLPEDKIEAMILSGEIILALEGEAVGKANALAVHDRGYYAFGCPIVVSARVAPGDGGIVNIEGESGLSGEIFDKAVLILSGYLRSRYARGFPLSVTASVCFEQSYTAIDGDSATAVQLCALLSSISGIPIRQDLALTGSVNQFGDIQPVGGVSEKIEGFHSICSKRGLSGTQGVVVPRRNIQNLILSDEVEDNVRAGRFHIYAVDTIDQAIEVLTGAKAGAEDKSGRYPESSLNGLVSKELERMAKVIRRFET